jgi:hypothetical protein
VADNHRLEGHVDTIAHWFGCFLDELA